MDPYSLATRNTVEIITDEDLRRVLDQPKKRVYAGYEPSGEIHLGHLVTVNKLVDLKEAGFDVVVLLADLHAFLNRKGTMEKVRELAEPLCSRHRQERQAEALAGRLRTAGGTAP